MSVNIGSGENTADITITKGSTFKADMQWKAGPQNERVPVDISSLILRMQVRSAFDSDQVILQLMSHYPPGLDTLQPGEKSYDEGLLEDLGNWTRYVRDALVPSYSAIYINTTDLDPESNEGVGDLTFAQNGKFQLYIPHTITRSLTQNSGQYDVEVVTTDSIGQVYTERLWRGNVSMRDEITRTPVGNFQP